MALEIIWGSGSPYAWRVLLGAEIKGLAYESTVLEFSKGHMKTPEFLKLNPRGKVPVIRDDGFVLYESLAILDYLDGKHSRHMLFGESQRKEALIRRTISEFESYVRAALEETVVGLLTIAGAAPAVGAVREEDLDAAAARVRRELGAFEILAREGAWLAGEQPSAADAVVYPIVRLLQRAATKSEARA